MQAQKLIYNAEEVQFEGYYVYDNTANSHVTKPTVLVVHDWSGRNEFACQKAELLAELGYVGIALDMYGDARVGTTIEEKTELMKPLKNNRGLVVKRMRAGLEAALQLPMVNPARVAVIGFCFGGMCALDLGRSGADIKGVVSFHGMLAADKHVPAKNMSAKVLVLHGHNDPMVPPKHVLAFQEEMTEANVDWQTVIYGHTSHAFTNPQAHDEKLGLMYNKVSAKRAWQNMLNFLQELFE